MRFSDRCAKTQRMTSSTETSPAWPADAVRDQLIGDWHFWQRTGGHRTSTDDLLAAWLAVRMWRARSDAPPPRYLDLGCGIGSVLLMTAHALRPVESIGVEVQPQSALMARRSVDELPSPPPIRIENADLREVDATLLGGKFPLVTGSPPYMPVSDGVVSPDPQRAGCRFELRGGVEAYCATAAAVLQDDGVFCLVFQTTWDARVLEAGAAAGLSLIARADVRTKTNREAPFLTVYAFAKVPQPLEKIELATRDADGELTAEYREVRAVLGLR